MFYTKLHLDHHNELVTYLGEDNVYGICPVCGKETTVDLAGILKEEDTDLYNTSVYCDNCTKAWLEEKGLEANHE